MDEIKRLLLVSLDKRVWGLMGVHFHAQSDKHVMSSVQKAHTYILLDVALVCSIVDFAKSTARSLPPKTRACDRFLSGPF